MSETPTALRVHVECGPCDGAWDETAQKLMLVAADEIDRMKRDHIGAHRICCDTIRFLENKIENLNIEVHNLKHDIERALANHSADLTE